MKGQITGLIHTFSLRIWLVNASGEAVRINTNKAVYVEGNEWPEKLAVFEENSVGENIDTGFCKLLCESHYKN